MQVPAVATTCAIRAMCRHLSQAMNPAWIGGRMPLVHLYEVIRIRGQKVHDTVQGNAERLMALLARSWKVGNDYERLGYIME